MDCQGLRVRDAAVEVGKSDNLRASLPFLQEPTSKGIRNAAIRSSEYLSCRFSKTSTCFLSLILVNVNLQGCHFEAMCPDLLLNAMHCFSRLAWQHAQHIASSAMQGTIGAGSHGILPYVHSCAPR